MTHAVDQALQRSPSRVNILGVLVSAIGMQRALQIIDAWVTNRERHYVTVTPAHAVMDAYKDPELRRVFNHSGLTTPDGMAIVWILKLRGYRNVSRVYGPDLMLEVCRAGLAQGYRHFLYGGGIGVAAALAEKLRARLPGLRIVGTHTPPFRELTEEEDRQVIELTNACNPDIVWVGLSTPKQERWMTAHRGGLEAPVLIGVGAAFDFLSGHKPQAPRWMQRGGLEWLFRLATEPRRLWPRYREYPLFALLVAGQLLGLRTYSQEE
jgi:N-acetylglucosaminyldiphosphoundecaprenol N-acetyl-beta-D-mannosaminyltransferase